MIKKIKKKKKNEKKEWKKSNLPWSFSCENELDESETTPTKDVPKNKMEN